MNSKSILWIVDSRFSIREENDSHRHPEEIRQAAGSLRVLSNGQGLSGARRARVLKSSAKADQLIQPSASGTYKPTRSEV